MSSDDHAEATWQSEPYHLAARYRTLAVTELGPVRLTEIEGRGRLLPHALPVATFYFCLSGEGELATSGPPRAIGPDDHWIIPASGLHALSNRGQTPLRLLIMPVAPPVRPARRLVDRWKQWLPGR